ncbi:hypothetical protein STEG23_021798 [Scotinomys teguina]
MKFAGKWMDLENVILSEGAMINSTHHKLESFGDSVECALCPDHRSPKDAFPPTPKVGSNFKKRTPTFPRGASAWSPHPQIFLKISSFGQHLLSKDTDRTGILTTTYKTPSLETEFISLTRKVSTKHL